MSAVAADPAADLASAVARLAELHAAAGVVSGRGLEAWIAGATLGVSKRAWILPGVRESGAALLRGAAADALHRARPYRVVPAGASPSARAAQAVGLGLAGESALCFLGTGSVAYGTLAEVLPMVVPGIQLAVTWYERPGPFARPLSPAALGRAAGLEVAEVDATDAAAVYAAVRSGAAIIVGRR